MRIVQNTIALVPVAVPEALVKRAVRFVIEDAETLGELVAEVSLVVATVRVDDLAVGLHGYLSLAEVRRSEQSVVSLRQKKVAVLNAVAELVDVAASHPPRDGSTRLPVEDCAADVWVEGIRALVAFGHQAGLAVVF